MNNNNYIITIKLKDFWTIFFSVDRLYWVCQERLKFDMRGLVYYRVVCRT